MNTNVSFEKTNCRAENQIETIKDVAKRNTGQVSTLVEIPFVWALISL